MLALLLQGLQEIHDGTGTRVALVAGQDVAGEHVLHDAGIGQRLFGIVDGGAHVQRLLHGGIFPSAALQFRQIVCNGRRGVDLAGLDHVQGQQASDRFGGRPQDMARLLGLAVVIALIDQLTTMQHHQPVGGGVLLPLLQADLLAVGPGEGHAVQVHRGAGQGRRLDTAIRDTGAGTQHVDVARAPMQVGQLQQVLQQAVHAGGGQCRAGLLGTDRCSGALDDGGQLSRLRGVLLRGLLARLRSIRLHGLFDLLCALLGGLRGLLLHLLRGLGQSLGSAERQQAGQCHDHSGTGKRGTGSRGTCHASMISMLG